MTPYAQRPARPAPYTAWLVFMEQLQRQLETRQLPAPAPNQPPIQVMPTLHDPWTQPGSMTPIAQSYVGSITANGEAFVFGVALDRHQLVYLDYAGPVETVKTIRSQLVSQGRACYLNPPQGDTIMLWPDGKQSLDVQHKKIAYGLVHCILTHRSMRQPVYDELSSTYLIFADKTQATARLGMHIHHLLQIPVRRPWYPYLVQQGRFEGLITPCESYGGIQLYRITLDRQRWTTVIQRGLQRGTLVLVEGDEHGTSTG